MEYDLLQNTRDQNEELFKRGYINKIEYFENEQQLNAINQLFIVNLN